MEDFYKALDISQDADQEQIKKAYRALAKKHHPDTDNGDEEKFRHVNRAYTVLSNTESRKDYDKTLRNYKNGTSSVDAYTADVYELQGKQIENVLREIAEQGQLTRVKIKQKGKTLIDMPFTTAAGLTLLGFVFAPIVTLLVNMGINRYFELEVTNIVMEKFDKALKSHNSGNLIEAENIYKEVIKTSEFFVPAHMNLAMLYRQRGENKLAIDGFKRVLELAPFGELGDIAKENLESLRGF